LIAILRLLSYLQHFLTINHHRHLQNKLILIILIKLIPPFLLSSLYGNLHSEVVPSNPTPCVHDLWWCHLAQPSIPCLSIYSIRKISWKRHFFHSNINCWINTFSYCTKVKIVNLNKFLSKQIHHVSTQRLQLLHQIRRNEIKEHSSPIDFLH
jgi:hypothetical protein